MAIQQSIRIETKKSIESITEILQKSEYGFKVHIRDRGIFVRWKSGFNHLQGTIVNEGNIRTGCLELSCLSHRKFLEIKEALVAGFKSIGVTVIL